MMETFDVALTLRDIAIIITVLYEADGKKESPDLTDEYKLAQALEQFVDRLP